MKAIGYLRISKRDQSHHSLEYQERAIREYCSYNQVELISIFTDNGESSYTFDRPDYKALEDFIKQHKGSVKYLIVLDHDRFSRNLPEALLKIEQLEKKFGIKVVATSESLDIDTGDPSVFMLRAFKYLVANQELFTIRRRAKLGIRQAQLSGRYVNLAPFGLKNAKQSDGRGIMSVDKEKAFLIQKIFKDYLSGIPHYLIYKEVIKLGFPRKGNSAIVRVLTNPLYAGLVKVSATEKEPEKIVKGLHEAIISPDIFWRTQDLLIANKRTEKQQPKEDFPLKGILKSSCCGSNMTAGWSRGKKKYYLYYRCLKHSSNNVSGIQVHEKFSELLRNLSFSQKQIDKIKSDTINGLNAATEQRAVLLNNNKELLKTNNSKLENLEEKFINNEIGNDTYSKWSKKYRIENTRLKEEIYKLESSSNDKIEEQLRLLPRLMNMREIYEKATIRQKYALIKRVFKQGVVYLKNGFRTPYINPLFAHNIMNIKEKGLLTLEQSFKDLDELPSCGEGGT